MNNNNKHAFLIIAHGKFNQLQILLNLLDDERNDLYVHIDKKAQIPPPSVSRNQNCICLINKLM